MKSLIKRSAVKQLACFLLAVMITAAFVPLPARAATEKYNYKIISLSQKKWVTAKPDSYNKNTNTYTFYLYKITVPANGFIRIDTKSDFDFNIYKTINKKKSIEDNQVYELLYEGKTYRRVLPKGTYYINAGGMTLKWQFTTAKNPTNFCRTRSTRLKAGYKKTEVFNFGYEFDRWYRISLTARKPINVTLLHLDTYFLDGYSISSSIYNSQGIRVSCKKLEGINFKTAVLPRGTYYIRIHRSLDEHLRSFEGRICQFWWR